MSCAVHVRRCIYQLFHFKLINTTEEPAGGRSLVPVAFARSSGSPFVWGMYFLCVPVPLNHRVPVPHPLSVASDERTERNCYA
jgi:hypothetical protein